jgi:hypothetical protein
MYQFLKMFYVCHIQLVTDSKDLHLVYYLLKNIIKIVFNKTLHFQYKLGREDPIKYLHNITVPLVFGFGPPSV